MNRAQLATTITRRAGFCSSEIAPRQPLLRCPTTTTMDGLRRVIGENTKVMPRCQCIYLNLLFTTDMNRRHLAETRRRPIHGGSASASLQLTVSARCLRSMSLVIIYGTAVKFLIKYDNLCIYIQKISGW